MIRSGRDQAQRKQHRATAAAARPDIAEKVLQYFRQNEEFVQMTPGGSVDPQATKKAIATLRQLAGRKHDSEVVAALCSVAAGSKKEPGGRA